MSAGPGLLDLSPGARLLLGGRQVLVEWVEPQHSLVLVCGHDGQRHRRSVRSLVNDPDCQPVAAGGLRVDRGRQPAGLEDLPAVRREQLGLRVAHLLEMETGFRSGDPLRPLPGEPRAGYDPAATTLVARRQAKAAELGGLGPDEARLLGWEYVSERTLRRLAASYHRFGPIGCVDGRWLRRRSGHRVISDEVREAIFAIHAETLHRSKLSMRARERLIHQYVRERFGPGVVVVPTYETLRVVWAEWFGPGGARQRYLRSAAAVEPSAEHVVVHRPGQVVALDTTVLPVKVREHVFGEAVSVHLTLALDVYTHSIVAFRLTMVSDTSVDVAMLLRDMTMPLPLRQGWGQDMEWPYPGIPAAVVVSAITEFVSAHRLTSTSGSWSSSRPRKTPSTRPSKRTLSTPGRA